jgi:hypothetical protein
MTNIYKVLVRKFERKRSLLMLRRTRKVDVKNYLTQMVHKCVGVLVIRALVFIVFCIVRTVFLYCFVYVYLFLTVLSVLA